MDVLVAGGHGKIALRLLRLLAERGDRARGLIRNPDHGGDVERAGAEAMIGDLEADDGLEAAVTGADAVVFAAGAGPGSGPERKRTVDLGGALKLIEACEATGVSRYLMVSAIGADRDDYPAEMEPYYAAKREADEALRASALAYTILRPGGLTDGPGSGSIAVGSPLAESGQIPRDDVAAALLAVLDEPRTAGLTFDLIAGDVPISEAIRSLLG